MDEGGILNVPYDIIRNIFIRLPVKCLLRFKAVSKTCLSTICDPVFVSAHLRQSKNSTQQNLFIEGHCYVYGEAKLIKIENQKCEVESVLIHPSQKYDSLFLACRCEGLFIFRYIRRDLHNLFLLWNPSSRTIKSFWCPYALARIDPSFYGLCYDPLIEDYKFLVTDMSQYYVIFHFRNNYWIEREEFLLNEASYAMNLHQNLGNFEGVCFDGALYWLLYDDDPRGYKIVCFDSKDNKHRIVHKPASLQSNNKGCWYMTLVGGHLCLYHDIDYTSVMQIFTLKKDGDQDKWMEFITIDLSLVSPPSNFAEPVFLTNENEIILRVRGNRLVVYNPSKKTFMEIEKKLKVVHPCLTLHLDNLFFSSGSKKGYDCTFWVDEEDIDININYNSGFERHKDSWGSSKP